MKPVLFYGAGRFSEELLRQLPGAEKSIAAFVDRDESKERWLGRPVLRPVALHLPEYESFPVVVSLKNNRADVAYELQTRFGLPSERVLSLEKWAAQALEDPAVTLRPEMARVDVSTCCQLDCTGCYMRLNPDAPVGSGFLSLEHFCSFLEENPFLKRVEMSNSGEPFLNPKLAQMLRFAHERGVELSFSNGANFNTVSDEVLEELVRCQVPLITVSLDGASQEVYSRYRRRGDYEAVIRNIRKLNQLKERYGSSLPRLIWQFILMPEDEEDVEAAIRTARELDMGMYFKLDYRSGFQPKDPERLTELTGLHFLTQKDYNSGQREFNGQYCSQLFYSPQINWDGRLLGCCTLYKRTWEHNVFEEGFLASINHSDYRTTLSALLRGEPACLQTPCMSCTTWKKMHEKGLCLTL